MMDKKKIRSMMPPTTRNFETRLNDLHDRVSRIDERLSKIERKRDLQSAITASNSEYSLFASLSSLQRRESGVRILLAGWYGADNCGDELMMQTMLSYIPDELLSRTTVLLWRNDDYPIGKLDPRITTLHYPPTIQGVQALSELFDILIWGGGALLDDAQFDLRPMNNDAGNLFIHLSKRMLVQDKRIFCISLSASDSLTDSRYREELQFIIDKAEYFSLRDPYSRDILLNSGVDVSRIRLDDDIVFANKTLHELSERGTSSNMKEKSGSIGLVLHCFEELFDFNYRLIEDIVETVSSSEVRRFDELLLIPFYDEYTSDTAHLGRLLERFVREHPHDTPPRLMSYEDDLERSPLLECRLTISCRYHAALLSGCLRIPFIAICNDMHSHYPNKMKYLIERFFPGHDSDRNLIYLSSYSKETLKECFKTDADKVAKEEVVRALFQAEADILSELASSL